MAFYPCSIANCLFDALIHESSCWICRQRFCFQHLKHPLHECSMGIRPDASNLRHDSGEGYEPEVSQLISLLDQNLIKEEVESLRPGHQVNTIDVGKDWKEFSSDYLEGNMNFHVKIDFQDGCSWLMRIRRRSVRNYTDEPLRINMMSEVATVQALHQAGIAVPQAFARPQGSKSHPKLIYCYQTIIPGTGWKPFYDHKERIKPLSDPSINYIKNVARWFINLEKTSYEKVGSLTLDEESNLKMGPIIGRYPYHSTPPYYIGPFSTSKEMWIATIDAHLELLRQRRYCDTQNEIWMYLCLLEAKALVLGCKELEDQGPFYIKHDDDQGDHIRATEDGEVTGITDWEWAYTTSKAEAFTSPSGFVLSEYHYGNNDKFSNLEITLIESYIQLGRPDLAGYVKDGRKYHRLIDLLRWMMYTPEQLDAMRRAFHNMGDDLQQTQTQEECIEGLKEKHKDDKGLRWLLDNPRIPPPLQEVEKTHFKRKKKKQVVHDDIANP